MDHKIMKPHDWDDTKYHASGCVGIKYDGIRGFYYPGEPELWTRNGKRIHGMGHIVEEFERRNYDQVSDVELIIPGMEFNKSSGYIRNYNDTPDAVAMVIDTPSHAGQLRERLNARPADVDGSPIKRIPHFYTSKIEHVNYYYNLWLDAGHEGLVWKSMSHRYDNAKSWHWMRKVPVHTVDLEVIGMYEGKGKMAGICGGLVLKWGNRTCKVGTMKGIDYNERLYMWNNQEEYIGRIAEVHFKNYQPSGLPRQPRFYCWRWDK